MGETLWHGARSTAEGTPPADGRGRRPSPSRSNASNASNASSAILPLRPYQQAACAVRSTMVDVPPLNHHAGYCEAGRLRQWDGPRGLPAVHHHDSCI